MSDEGVEQQSGGEAGAAGAGAGESASAADGANAAQATGAGGGATKDPKPKPKAKAKPKAKGKDAGDKDAKKDKSAKKEKGKGKSKGKSPAYSLAGHPRAGGQIRRAKAWGGLAGFALAGYFSLKAGVPPELIGIRALAAGALGYMLGWACSVTIWRQLVIAELRATAAERTNAPRSNKAIERPGAERGAEAGSDAGAERTGGSRRE